ncbi:serine/threonine receptor-like kinase NFP [Cucurbita pepo subsp. pepo]|uniref:serine/threonine receptor-like kinase NFP n=1 Tax=Cucurbita pepo subsp. pepo TaxID=3664 RepID=UPI000C9D4CDB|nr:serine/threonine receptor-like kinase NFP [Cucurbita pepo subsp. pepo]
MLLAEFMLLLACFFSIHGGADSAAFPCPVDSPRSCRTYVSYFAKSPEFLDLVSISSLFGVSGLKIAKASNLGSETAPLFDGQLLLVPVDCHCSENGFFHNVTYKIKKDDTFFHVSTTTFENLCAWNMVQKMNPNLNPTKLQVGAEVVFPLLCKCPSEKNIKQGIQYLITYVWQPNDEVSRVSAIFNVSEEAINVTDFTVGKPIYVPVSKLPLFSLSWPRRKNIKHLVIIIVALGISFLLVSLLGVYIWLVHKKKTLPIWEISIFGISKLTKKKMTKQSRQLQVLPPVVSDYLGRPIFYEFEVITEATMNFNEGFKIGKSLYRAEINGEISVVKEAKQDSKEELMILQKVNHISLVKLVGFSSDYEDNFYLVYEFAENGSLDKWLHSPSPVSSGSVSFHLTWSQRLNIALDVANGLQYMHDHTQPSIVHRDIKTGCILLDSRFRAKISNLAKARPATGSLSTKVDIFAFGVVILELLSGRKEVKLCEEIREVLEQEQSREEKLRDWMDPKLQSFYPIEGALSLALMARACTQEEPLSRPTMAEIVFNLCVLAESPIEKAEKTWVSLLEADEIAGSHGVIRAR